MIAGLGLVRRPLSEGKTRDEGSTRNREDPVLRAFFLNVGSIRYVANQFDFFFLLHLLAEGLETRTFAVAFSGTDDDQTLLFGDSYEFGEGFGRYMPQRENPTRNRDVVLIIRVDIHALA